MKAAMKLEKSSPSPLSFVENSRISSITFAPGYVQFHFDGPCLNAYVWPKIKFDKDVVKRFDSSYTDSLIELVGKTLISAHVDPYESITLELDDQICLEISLHGEDLVKGEAAMLQDSSGKIWEVW
jgi:hypothetical protein